MTCSSTSTLESVVLCLYVRADPERTFSLDDAPDAGAIVRATERTGRATGSPSLGALRPRALRTTSSV